MQVTHLTTGFSLGAVLTWGTADFLGGLAARRTNAFLVVFMANVSAIAFISCVALSQHAPFPSRQSALWGLAAGAVGNAALALFYKALSSGSMGLNAPVAAVLAASIPVLLGMITEGLPHPLQVLGFGLALISIWLISRPEHGGGRPEGFGLAVIAGIGFAGFFLFSHQAGQASALWIAGLSRTAGLAVVSLILLVRRTPLLFSRQACALALMAGLFDVSGTAAYVRASQLGRLDVAVILSSLYPAVTVILATFFLKEHFSRLKLLGMAAALISVPLITLR